jgi:hypothetical protein
MSRKEIGLLLGVLFIIFLYYLTFVSEPSLINDDDVIIGEVWGDLSTNGRITGYESFSSRDYGIYGYSHSSSFYIMNISNISSVIVRERKGGGEFERTYLLENQCFSIQMNRGSIFCNLRNARIDYELNELYGEPQDANRYIIYTNFKSMNGNAQIIHNDLELFDIRTYRSVTAIIDNETLLLDKGDFVIPNDEVADIVIRGHGSLGFDYLPIFQVDGHIKISQFSIVTSKGLKIRTYEDFKVNGKHITILTRQKPDYWVDHNEHIVPWIIGISTKGGSSTDISTNFNYGHIIIFLVLIILFLGFLRAIIKKYNNNVQ